jgi:hypothetical protein
MLFLLCSGVRACLKEATEEPGIVEITGEMKPSRRSQALAIDKERDSQMLHTHTHMHTHIISRDGIKGAACLDAARAPPPIIRPLLRMGCPNGKP